MADLCERTIGDRRGEFGWTGYLNRMTAFMRTPDLNWQPPGAEMNAAARRSKKTEGPVGAPSC